MKAPILAHLTPATKLIFLLLLVIFCFITVSLAGVLFAVPLFHLNLFKDLTILNNFDNPASVGLLKYLQIIQSFGLFILPAILAGIFFGGNMNCYLGTNKGSFSSVFLGTLLIMFVSLPLINWLTSVNEMMSLPGSFRGIEQWMKETEEEASKITEAFLNVKTTGGLLVNILMIAIIPALGEELFFRGLLQRLFSEWFKNVHIAIFFTAFLFGAIHLQFYGILPRIFLGVVLGYLFFWTGSLWVPVFAHFINNGSAVLISYLANRGFISTGYEDFGATNNVFLITGSILFTAGLLFLVYRSTGRRKKALDDSGFNPPPSFS